MMDSVLDIVVLFVSVLIAGGMGMLGSKSLRNKTGMLLSFSGAYLLGLCLLHLLPFLFNSPLVEPGLWIMVGFFIQIFLEFFSGGVEHGHFHQDHFKRHFPWTVMIGLCLHAFFEGMPFGAHTEHQHSLLVGIVLHKVPVALVLTGMLQNSGFSVWKIVFWLMVFAVMAPAGAGAYQGIVYTGLFDPAIVAPAVNGLLVGILLHVSTTILFESSDGHRFDFLKFATIVLGMALAFFT